ncbi:MAG: response regulator [Saprospiraceae bacterium]
MLDRKNHLPDIIQMLLITAVMLSGPSLAGQGLYSSSETGQALIRKYSSREYGAGTQNWAVLQDRRGIVYVGNNECLLEFDGRNWQRVRGGNGGAFSLAMGADGKVYVGGAGDFGFLGKDADGRRIYVSLIDKLPAAARDFGVIRSVQALGDTVFFQSRQTLLLLSGDRVQVIKIPDSYLRSYVVDGSYVLKLAGRGLCVWRNGAFRTLPGGEAFDSEVVTCILPHSGGAWLVGTQKNGVWLYEPGTGLRQPASEFNDLQERWKKEELYYGLGLPDGDCAFATLSGGVYIVGRSGALKRHIDRKMGLSDNTVHHLFTDSQRGLWVSLNQGLDRISLQAPFEYWDAALGLDAAVLCIKRHRGTLYLGTNLGLYALQAPARGQASARFHRVGNLRDQIFALETVQPPGQSETLLLMASGSGLYALDGSEQIRRLHREILGPLYAIAVSRHGAPGIFAGGDKGLFFFASAGAQWSSPQLVAESALLVRSVAEDADGRLWVGFRNKGFARLESIEDDGWRMHFIDSLSGRPVRGDHRLFVWGNELLLRSSEYGTYRFDKAAGALVPFEFENTKRPVWVAATGPQQNIWFWTPSNSGLQLRWSRQTEKGRWQTVSQPLEMLPDMRDLFQGGIFQENDRVTWMGGAAGLYRFDAGSIVDSSWYQSKFPVLLRSVRSGGDSLLAVDWNGVSTGPIDIPFQHNTISFHFAAPDFERPENTRYSYLLEGFDRKWSSWTEKAEKEYSNLPPGDYKFRVRAQSPFIGSMESTAYEFSILPPWYRSWWAYLLYLALTSFLIYGLTMLITRQQARRLQHEQAINERLRMADKLKDQFLANTSHELRTPLNGIIGLSESLMDGLDSFSKEKQREELSLIVTSGKRLAGLVNDLLDFSRIREKDLQLRRGPVDLQSLTDVVLQICRPLVQGKDVALVNEVPADLPAVYTDEDRLQQILLNLLGNAAKFTQQGKIAVGARLLLRDLQEEDAPAGKFAEIYVADTGIGIAPEKQMRIFEAFEQADGSIEREFGGTGLGLAISKSLIELQGGSIRVESEEGRGATFLFTLPCSDEAGIRQERVIQEVPSHASGAPSPVTTTAVTGEPATVQGASPVKILIVDDEPVNHHVLRNHLAGGHFQVATAWNGEEALAMLDTHGSFDLILLDVMMPKMNGYEVCRRIRKKYLPSELPVIMVTAKNQVEDLVQGLSLGANDYLVKPFNKEELLARVKTQIDLLRIYSVADRFVPAEFIRALGHERITEVALGDQTQRDVTVLFSDIRDYTAFSEQMTPEDNFKFVNAYNGRMGPVIRQHEGFINQYLGDGIMAIFPRMPNDALNAAIQMQRIIGLYNLERAIRSWTPISVGMGLHTGSLIMGITGDEKRMDAATISDTVNTASRIENLTKYYGARILLSENTMVNIADTGHFGLRYLGKVQVKGKQKAVGIYECFDADPALQMERKRDTLNLFNMGIEQYLSRDFETAAGTMKKVMAHNPDDTVAAFFLNKIEGLLASGVPDDWTGVEKMDVK